MFIEAKLLVNELQSKILRETAMQFNSACNVIAVFAFKSGSADKVKLQKLVYQEIKEQFDLSSQLIIKAISKVSEVYKKDRSVCPNFADDDYILYDWKILSFKGLEEVSLMTIRGRIKIKFTVIQHNVDMLSVDYVKNASSLKRSGRTNEILLILSDEHFYLNINK